MSCTAAEESRKLDWAFIDVLAVDIKFRPAAYGGGGEWTDLPPGIMESPRSSRLQDDVYGYLIGAVEALASLTLFNSWGSFWPDATGRDGEPGPTRHPLAVICAYIRAG